MTTETQECVHKNTRRWDEGGERVRRCKACGEQTPLTAYDIGQDKLDAQNLTAR